MGGIRAYYDAKNEARQKIDVPEWQMVFFVGPLTVGQFERINATKTDGERNKEVIKACAKREDGSPALDPAAQEELDRYGTTDVVARVANQIMQACVTISGDPEKKD